VLPQAATNALVAAAIVSISLNPMLFRLVDPLDAWLARQPRLARWLGRRAALSTPVAKDNQDDRGARHRAVIVGYGPVGRTLSRLLRDNEVEPTIIDMNLETVRSLREEGVAAVYGDASHRDILKAAGVKRATGLLLSASGLTNAEQIIRFARELNPRLRVLVRCSYLRELPALRKAGAHGIFAAEGEVALAMTETVLRDLGAVREQIDRERERVRADLFGGASGLDEEKPGEGSLMPESVPAVDSEPQQTEPTVIEKQEEPQSAGE
jgi:CPA2 family monovalent cation:H+ antiporter-2